MQLTEKHIQVIKKFIETGEQAASYSAFMGRKKPESDKVAASNFFKRPEVKKMLKLLQDAKEKGIVSATEKVYADLYAKEIASELELDIFHTKVVRGQIEVQEVFAVKEKMIVNKLVNGKLVPLVEEKVLFKRVQRLPTIKEKQYSAAELYKRSGSYKPFKVKVSDNQDDQEAAEQAKGNQVETVERFIVLSNGEKLKMHG